MVVRWGLHVTFVSWSGCGYKCSRCDWLWSVGGLKISGGVLHVVESVWVRLGVFWAWWEVV